MAKRLVKIMSKERASDYITWRRVGFVLYTIDSSLYDTFVEFSKKDMIKYNMNKVTCEDIWKAAPEYTKFYVEPIGTLRHWAKTDNKKDFYELIKQFNDKIFGQAESGKHVDIAQVVYELYKDRFVCIDINKKKWLEFQDHRWVIVQSGYTLEELISSEVRRILMKYCSQKMNESTDLGDNDDDDAIFINPDEETKRYKKLMTTIGNLGDVKFRENIVRACANKFYNSKFQEKLDNNSYLVGFNNGIYDLKELCFREGLPTDYVSKSVGYDYIEYTGKEPIFEKINKFFSEVQTEQDMRDYLLTFIAKTLRGQPDQKLHLWNGGGGNGKSATVDLIKNMLGDYFGVVPVTILTRKKMSSSNATPELADKFGKRIIVVQEPEHNDVIYVGQMKELSGTDTILARPMYGEPFYYVPMFTMVLTCNNLPHIPSTDIGTWRRLKVVPFESEFVDKNPCGPKQFLKNNELQEDFPNWAQPLMWLVINKYYPVYEKGVNGKKYEIFEPEKVTQYSDNYKKDTDVYMEFITENIDTKHPIDEVESINFLFDTFKIWYNSAYSGGTQGGHSRKQFVAYLKKNNYKLDKSEQHLLGAKYRMSLC